MHIELLRNLLPKFETIVGLFETRGQNVPDRKLTVLAIEGKTRSTVMLYREG